MRYFELAPLDTWTIADIVETMDIKSVKQALTEGLKAPINYFAVVCLRVRLKRLKKEAIK